MREFGKAHGKDPRHLRGRSYSPEFQADMAQMALLRQRYENGHISLSDVLDAMADRTPPMVRVRNNFYAAFIPANDTPVLLLPANPRRMSFIIYPDIGGGFTSYFVSYGYPQRTVEPVVAFGEFDYGIATLLSVNEPFEQVSGIVSHDDIYVTAHDIFSPGYIFAFEGVPAPEAN